MTHDAPAFLFAFDDVAIQGYDADRCVFYWNKASENLYGYSREEALGAQLEDLLLPARMREQAIQQIQHWVLGGPPPLGGDLWLKHRDGHTVHVHSNHLALRDDRDTPLLFCIDVPVARQDSLESRLFEIEPTWDEQAGRKADDSETDAGFLVRTPLTAILEFSQATAAQTPGPAEAAEFACLGDTDEGPDTTTSDLAKAVSQSVALCRMAPVTLNPQPRPVQIQDILVEAASVLLSGRPDLRHRIVVTRVPGNRRATLDPFLTKQAVASLARHALANSGTAGTVTFSATERMDPQSTVHFSVGDTGPPMPDALRLRLLAGQPLPLPDLPLRSPYEAAVYQLVIAQRVALATGALLTFDRTPKGFNRATLAVRTGPPPETSEGKAREQS